MPKFQRHLFICTHEREADDPRGSCATRGSVEVAAAFKKKLYEAGFKRIVRPNRSGCLDQCAQGVTVVVYPDNVWYGHVTTGDVDEIINEHLVHGRTVERLVIPDNELTGIDPLAAPTFE
ncbi:MAG: (2Fe-2S) ferredoxin [Planctomycetota bacterium]|jgi:(2Fe-2S) ferredoxin